jgi:tetratricopeptide (TPR) repeat protein
MRISTPLVGLITLCFAAGPVSASRAAADDADTCATAVGDDAIAACTRAISSGRLHDHGLAAEYYNRGITYGTERDYDHAIADYTEAIRLDPQYADAFGNRANAYRDKHDLDRALADYGEALRIRPGANDYYNRGNAYYLKEDYDRAIADYTEAIRLDPNFARAYYNRGFAKRAKGDSANASADIAKAMLLNPGVGK